MIEKITYYKAFGEFFSTEESAKEFLCSILPQKKESLLKQKQILKQNLLPQAHKEFLEAKTSVEQRTRKLKNEDLINKLQNFTWKKKDLENLQTQLKKIRFELKQIYEYEEDIQKKF